MPTILLSAGDASGQAHAAQLVRVLRDRMPEARFVGLGGPAMAASGVELLADSSALAVGGIFEVAGSFGRIRSTWRAMVDALRALQPELVVLVDSGGFNLPLARRARELTNARVLYYVAPQLWAWRARRLPKLVARTDRIAVLFPFERDYYAEQGVEVDYVGHPILDAEVARPVPADAQKEARRALGLVQDRPILALLPGSRRNEVSRQLPVQLRAWAQLRTLRPELGDLQAIVGTAPSLDEAWLRGIVKQTLAEVGDPANPESVELATGNARLFDAVDVALTKPGTVTVELMLRTRPMVVMGRVHPLTGAIVRRGLQVPWVSMPNLLADAQIVPELLQAEATPDRIAEELARLFAETPRHFSDTPRHSTDTPRHFSDTPRRFTDTPRRSLDDAERAIDSRAGSRLSAVAREQISALAGARAKLGPPGATARVADLVEEMMSSHA